MEPKHVDEAIQDDNWVKAMQKDLDQFQKNDVQKLVKLPKGKKAVGAKWVFSKKLNRNGKVVRNKARLVGKLVKIIHDYIVQPKGKKVVVSYAACGWRIEFDVRKPIIFVFFRLLGFACCLDILPLFLTHFLW